MHRLLSSFALALVGLTIAMPQDELEGWQRVEPGTALVFPRDHGSHPAQRTEWWYLTGHLSTEEGAVYGFQFTIFRQGIDPSPPREGESRQRAHHVFAGHLALADVTGARLLLAERVRRESPLAGAATDDLDLHLEDWTLARASDGRVQLDAGDAAADIHLALKLDPTRPLVLHGDRGHSQKGPAPGNASMYTSWTRLAARGSLAIGGRKLDVHGQAWFDHEFGTSQLPAGTIGWDWFSVQLDDGRDLMLYRLRDERGEPSEFSSGTLVDKEGRAIPLARSDFVIDALTSWRSPRTHASYPASWRVRVPAQDIDLQLVPLVPDCELDTTRSTGVIYWEGPIRVEGSATGRGYAELTGYAGSLGGRF